MNTTDPTVVVVTEERKSRRGLFWIATAMATVLLGGSTFALWAANATFTGGTITAGDLNIAQKTNTAFYDVSIDRTDTAAIPGTDGVQKGHTIDPTTWLMVPGDKVAAVFTATVTLTGDNMVAQLSLEGLSTAGTNDQMTWTYEVYLGSSPAAPLITETAIPGSGPLLYLSAVGTGQAAGLDDTVTDKVYAMAGATADLTVVVYGEFDPTAGDAAKSDVNSTTGVYTDQGTDTGTRQNASSTAVLDDLLLTLEQVRDTGAIFQ